MARRKIVDALPSFVLCVDGDTIKDERGREYTMERARELWAAGRVRDCNLSFQRLMTLGSFEALRDYYARADQIMGRRAQ